MSKKKKSFQQAVASGSKEVSELVSVLRLVQLYLSQSRQAGACFEGRNHSRILNRVNATIEKYGGEDHG